MRALFILCSCLSSLITLAQNVNRVEYYFDTDPGFGNGISIPLTAASDLTQDFTVPLNSISEGFHLLYFRAKSNGLWSIPTARPVFVQRNAKTTSVADLKRIEFFIDIDPGPGNGTQLSISGTNYDQLTIVDLSSVSTGFHILYIRSQDQHGHWSHSYSKPFFVQSSGTNIVAIEYYFDDGTTQTPMRSYNSFTPGKDLTIDFSAVLDGLLPNTTYTIHLVAIDVDGKRSTEVTHIFTTPTVICDPLTPPLTVGGNRCESGTVTLTASGATGLQTYHWYANATDLTPIVGVNGNTFITPNLSSNTSYFVSIVNGTCESSRVEVMATVLSCNLPPEILTVEITAATGSLTEYDVTPLLSDPDNNLDPTTLRMVTEPAKASSLLSATVLVLDYTNSNFVGTDFLELEVCDLLASCTQQTLTVKVVGELTVFNALSPGGKNPVFRLENIDLLPDTRENRVIIYNRWGDEVFSVTDYNNSNRAFIGLSSDGGQLPAGTYFYKVTFVSGRKMLTGYLEIRY